MFADLHCDTMLKIKKKLGDYEFSVSEAYQAGGGVQLFACYIDVAAEPHPFRKAEAAIRRFTKAVARDPRIDIALSYADIVSITGQGRVAAVLTIEDCGILEGSIENLYSLYEMGVRVATLTWNGENQAASGCRSAGGLKPFGKRLLREMEKLGMIADVSHLNRRGFFETLHYTRGPVVATHSCSYDVFAHERNLTRRQAGLLAQAGGLVGVCFYPLFLNGTYKASIGDIMRHIDYFYGFIPDAVCFGSDFDGVKALPDEIKSSGDVEKLCRAIEMSGGAKMREQVAYRNAMRFFERYL